MAAAVDLSAASGDPAAVSRVPAPVHFVCGRFLSMKKPVVIPSLVAAISSIWGLKEKISIQEEENGVFVFLFKDKKEKTRVLTEGSWFYGGSMLVLADYDGLRPLEGVDLYHLEIWVAVKGLRIGMRDDPTLARFGRELGEFIDVDPMLVRRRDVTQRIRIRHDVRNRILPRRWFDFSPEFPVLLETRYEKCHGICADCGFFGHGGGACDKGLMVAASPRGLTTPGAVVAASSAGTGGGDLTSPRAGSEVGSGSDASLEQRGGCLVPLGGGGVNTGPSPVFSAPTPNLKLGLTGPSSGPAVGCGGVRSGPHTDVTIGPFGFRKNQKKRARYDEVPPFPKLAVALGLTEEDMEKPITSLKRKSGRILGSKNKVPRPSKKTGPQPPRVALDVDVAVKVSPDKGKGIA